MLIPRLLRRLGRLYFIYIYIREITVVSCLKISLHLFYTIIRNFSLFIYEQYPAYKRWIVSIKKQARSIWITVDHILFIVPQRNKIYGYVYVKGYINLQSNSLRIMR